MAGAMRTFTVTLTGAIQNLGTVFPVESGTPWRELHFTSQAQQTAVYIGEAGSGVSATNYASVAPANAAREVVWSAVDATPFKWKDIEVLGTQGALLAIGAVAY